MMFRLLYDYNKKKVLSNNFIWLFSASKSASTFLQQILIELWKEDCVYGSSIPAFGQRAWEPDVFCIRRHLLGQKKRYFSGHMHTKNTFFT